MVSGTDLGKVYHHIRVKLYRTSLRGVEGSFIARTSNDRILSIEDVCAILKTRAGFTGKYEDLLEYVRQYLEEMAYQLCDGNAVNNGYYCVYPNIGGTFKTANEGFDQKKHPLSFRFRIGSRLRKLLDNIEIIIDGRADTSGSIDEFTDVRTETVNDIVTKSSLFTIIGSKIKVAGDDPDCGIYFEIADGKDEGKRIKVTENLAENTSTRVIGIVPALTAKRLYRTVIVTQFTNGSTLLKEARTIYSEFILTAA